MKDIYSDLNGEVVVTELGCKRVILYDGTSRRNPTLIIDNELMAQRIIAFLKNIDWREEKEPSAYKKMEWKHLNRGSG